MNKLDIEVFKFEMKGREVIGLRYGRDPNIKNELDKRIRKSGKGVADASGWSQDQQAWYIDPAVWEQIRPSLAKRFNLLEADENSPPELTAVDAAAHKLNEVADTPADSLDDEDGYVN
jgi:hypothetical protein